MRKEYDFSNARRAKDIPHLAKLQEAMSRNRVSMTNDRQATQDNDYARYQAVANPAFVV